MARRLRHARHLFSSQRRPVRDPRRHAPRGARRGPLPPRSEAPDAAVLGGERDEASSQYFDGSCGGDMICILRVVPPEEERGLPEKKLGVY